MEENSVQKFPASENVFIIGALTLIGLLFFTIQTIISPFIITAALIIFLFPFRKNIYGKTFLILTGFIFTAWLLKELSSVLLPFFATFLLAYLLNPVVNRLERFSFPRWISSLLLLCIVIGIIITLLVLIVPLAITQLDDLMIIAKQLTNDTMQSLQSGQLADLLRRFNIPVENLQEKITMYVTPNIHSIVEKLLFGASNFLTTLTSLVSQIVNIVIIPFLAFYTLKDFPRLKVFIKEILPNAHREMLIESAQRIDALVGKYIRGLFIVATITGIFVATLLSIFGIRYAIVIGFVAAVMDFIPYFGVLITCSLSVVIAMFSGEPMGMKILLAAGTIIAVQVLEVTIYQPNFIGKIVGLHPVLLVLALFIFSYFLGFIGLLIAVPTTAIIMLFFHEWNSKRIQEWKNSL